MYKQIIIARKDLNMSPGKLAAQVSHASMAFLIEKIKKAKQTREKGNCGLELRLEAEILDEWIQGSFTKCILGAKNHNQLMRAADMAIGLGMKEGEDFFLIRDYCFTELIPEDKDPSLPNGGSTLTCIGFKPMDSEIIDKVGRKFQLWK